MSPPVFIFVIQAMEVLTPAGWRKGGKTLKPGPALVGKVWEVWQPEQEV